jgi:hypothetical protein
MSQDSDLYIPAGASDRERQIRRQVHAQAEFFRHLAIYIGVILLLWTINLLEVGLPSAGANPWRYWAVWPTIGWGIGVAIHAVTTLTRVGMLSRDWEERKVRELMQRHDAPR